MADEAQSDNSLIGQPPGKDAGPRRILDELDKQSGLVNKSPDDTSDVVISPANKADQSGSDNEPSAGSHPLISEAMVRLDGILKRIKESGAGVTPDS